MRKRNVCKTTVKSMGFSDRMIDEMLPTPNEKLNSLGRRAPTIKVFDLDEVERVMQTEEFKRESEKHRKRQEAAKRAHVTRELKMQEKFEQIAATIKVKKLDPDTLVRNAIIHNCMFTDRFPTEDRTMMHEENEYISEEDRERETFEEYCARYERERAPKEYNSTYFTEFAPDEDKTSFKTCLSHFDMNRFLKNAHKDYIDRIVVNYIRHQLCDYDEWVDYIFNLGFTTKDKQHDYYYAFKVALMNKISSTYPEYEQECARQIHNDLDMQDFYRDPRAWFVKNGRAD